MIYSKESRVHHTRPSYARRRSPRNASEIERSEAIAFIVPVKYDDERCQDASSRTSYRMYECHSSTVNGESIGRYVHPVQETASEQVFRLKKDS